MKIIRATGEHIDEVARLFDLYRQFYQCDPDVELARGYISARIRNNESTIFISIDGGSANGFVQLYPSFCSVEARKIQVLYDLYVDADSREHGIGVALMNKATEFARASGASRIDLLTAHTNTPGQALYEKLGYKKVLADFYAYSLEL